MLRIVNLILYTGNYYLLKEMVSSVSPFLYAIFLAVMIIFNIAGNSLVCLVILKKKAMKTSINWLLFHLAIADLLVALFFIPPCILSYFIEQPSGAIGDLLCKLINDGILGWMSAAASSFLLVAIAFERYVHWNNSVVAGHRGWCQFYGFWRPCWSCLCLW